MTYIIYGFAPVEREDNEGLDPDQQALAASELYRTEDYEEVKQIVASGGLEDARGVFCPLERIVSTAPADASDIAGAPAPARRQGSADLSLRKSEFDPIRNREGMTPLPPQNSRPSRGEQPLSDQNVQNIAEQSAESLTPRRTIHPSVPGVTKRQDK